MNQSQSIEVVSLPIEITNYLRIFISFYASLHQDNMMHPSIAAAADKIVAEKVASEEEKPFGGQLFQLLLLLQLQPQQLHV